MTSVIGRLYVRGYDMDYGQVFGYMGGMIDFTARDYQNKQVQYQNARSRYYGALSSVNSLNSNIYSIGGKIANLTNAQNYYANSARAYNLAATTLYGPNFTMSQLPNTGMSSTGGFWQSFTQADTFHYFNNMFESTFGNFSQQALFNDQYLLPQWYRDVVNSARVYEQNRFVMNDMQIKGTQANLDPNSWGYWALDQMRGFNNVGAGYTEAYYQDVVLKPNTFGNNLAQGAVNRPIAGFVETLALGVDVQNPSYMMYETQRFQASGYANWIDYQIYDKAFNSNIASTSNLIVGTGAVACTIATGGACGIVIGSGFIVANLGLAAVSGGGAIAALEDPLYAMYTSDSTNGAILIGSQQGDTIVYSSLQLATSVLQATGSALLIKYSNATTYPVADNANIPNFDNNIQSIKINSGHAFRNNRITAGTVYEIESAVKAQINNGNFVRNYQLPNGHEFITGTFEYNSKQISFRGSISSNGDVYVGTIFENNDNRF